MRLPWLKEDLLTNILTAVLAVILATVVSGILILTTGVNPLLAYVYLLIGAFGSVFNISETLVKFTPLLITALGIAVAFKSRCFNMGAEGQLYIGAVAATWIAVAYPATPGIILFPTFFIFGILGGGLWAAFPAVIKAKLGVNEIISTLMMNYVAIWLMNYLLSGPLSNPSIPGELQSEVIPSSVQLPILLVGTRLHAGILIGLVSLVFVYILLSKTSIGYAIRAAGVNPKAARYGGINVSKSIIISMVVSGGLAGLAGAVEIAGIHHSLINAFDAAPGYGFTAIAVALLGGLQPLGIFLSSLFMGGLPVGVDSMSRSTGIPIFLSYVMEALVVLFLLAAEYFRRIYPSISHKLGWLRTTGTGRKEN